MPRKLIAIALVAVLLAPTASQGEPPGRVQEQLEEMKEHYLRDLEQQNEALRKEVASLTAEVAKLKAQLAAKELKKRELEVKPLVPNSPQLRILPPAMEPRMIAPPSLQTLPPGTVEKRFNGEPFYVIPVSGK